MSGQSGSASDGWDELLSGLKVMVVDDDPLCLKVVEHMLKRCSYSGAYCNNKWLPPVQPLISACSI